jgi:hypothetical protein
MYHKLVCWTALPPSCSSAVACAISHSLLTKHWYIPWSSFCSGRIMSFSGDEVISSRLSRTIGFALWYHDTRVTGCPPVIHWNTASFPTSTTCVCGCTWADNDAATQQNINYMYQPSSSERSNSLQLWHIKFNNQHQHHHHHHPEQYKENWEKKFIQRCIHRTDGLKTI